MKRTTPRLETFFVSDDNGDFWGLIPAILLGPCDCIAGSLVSAPFGKLRQIPERERQQQEHCDRETSHRVIYDPPQMLH